TDTTYFGGLTVPSKHIAEQAEEIKYSAYFSKWYEHPQYYRHISMMIVRDSLSIRMNAGGIVGLDLETALNVVKLTGSYYMFLRNFIES
ncbi:unnamed protein product, partial [Callosobruchus maculatus]